MIKESNLNKGDKVKLLKDVVLEKTFKKGGYWENK